MFIIVISINHVAAVVIFSSVGLCIGWIGVGVGGTGYIHNCWISFAEGLISH